MELTEKNIDNRVLFINLVGPLFVFLTILISFQKPHIYLFHIACISIFSIIIAAKWGYRGLLFSLAILISFQAYYYSLFNSQLLWLFTQTSCLSLGLFITCQAYLEFVNKQASNKNNEDLQKELFQDLKREIVQLEAVYKEKTAECTKLSDELKLAYGKVDQLSEKEEIIKSINKTCLESEGKISFLKEELASLQHQLTQKNEQLDAMESDAAGKEKKIADLEAEVEEKKAFLENMNGEIVEEKKSLSERLAREISLREELQRNLEILVKNKNGLEKKLFDQEIHFTEQEQRLDEELADNRRKVEELRAINSDLQQQLQKLDKQVFKEEERGAESAVLVKEKEAYIHTLLKEIEHLRDQLQSRSENKGQLTIAEKESRRLYGMYNQLRTQFEQKSNELDFARRELFHVQEKLNILQKDWEEENLYNRSQLEKNYESYIERIEKEWQQLEEEYTNEIALLEDTLQAVLKQI